MCALYQYYRQEWTFEPVAPPTNQPPHAAFSSRSWDRDIRGGGRSSKGKARPQTYGGAVEGLREGGEGREGTGGEGGAQGRVGENEKEDSKLLTMLRMHRHVARLPSARAKFETLEVPVLSLTPAKNPKSFCFFIQCLEYSEYAGALTFKKFFSLSFFLGSVKPHGLLSTLI
jgi:hypothetical protein